MNRFIACCLMSLVGGAASAGSLNSIIPLPKRLQPAVMVRDSAGSLYLGGGPVFNASSGGFVGVSVTKLSSDGATVVFQTIVSSNVLDSLTSLVLAPDGSILLAGLTEGNFPVTQNAAEPVAGVNPEGFIARLDPNGNVIYASYFNADPSSQYGFNYLTLATDASGAVYVTGSGTLASTAGALPPTTPALYFVAKLDATGKRVWVTGAIGGSSIAVDAAGSVYVAGAAYGGGYVPPITPGAFQSTFTYAGCGNFGLTGFACSYQYVAKLSPSGANLIYCTWLSGTHGAIPATLLIDGEGNAIVTGYTPSFDYPVTPSAFQTLSFASQPGIPCISGGVGGCYSGPPYTGYVTKLNSTGTGLLFSTYLGGSVQDTVGAAALDAEGNIYLTGLAGSPDFPGLNGVPDGCLPTYVYQTPYFARLSADGSSITETRLAYGLFNAQENFGQSGYAPAVFDGKGGAIVAFQGSLADLSLSMKPQQFTCAVDAADDAPLAQIAPGQLVTLLGHNIGEPIPYTAQPQNGMISTHPGTNDAVKVHGILTPVLYSSLDQINIQIPYEIAGQAVVKLEIDDPGGNVVGLQEFPVVASEPSAFTNGAPFAACNADLTTDFLPAALNADGTFNSCGNPAAPDEIVTLFVNSLGKVGGAPVTGGIAASPAVPLDVPIVVSGDAQFVSAESAPGSTNSVWMVKVKLTPPAITGDFQAIFTLTVDGVPLREPLVVWTIPQK